MDDKPKKAKIPDEFKHAAKTNIAKEFWSVFISGLPYDTTQTQLEEIFGLECGDIVSTFFPCFQDTGRSRGYAHICYKNRSGFAKALRLNGTTLGSRYLQVAPSKGKQEHEEHKKEKPKACKSVRVGNLPYDAK